MVFHKEQYEISAANDDICTAPFASKYILKSHSGEDSKASFATTRVQTYKVWTVTFGLLALLQLGLIIYLALPAFHHKGQNGEKSELKMDNFGIQASLKNLTEEREQLISTISNVEAKNKNVSEERDELKKTLNDFTLQLKSLNEERNKLETRNFNMEATSKNLTEERDELKTKLDDLVSKQNSLTEERDNLMGLNSDSEARSRTISLERDELKKRLNTLDSQHRSVTEERDRMKLKLNILDQPGWILFRGSAYYISSTKNTWQESRNDCQSKGADLMIINSKEKQDFANSFQTYMWIGLTDSEVDGTWKWVDGSPLTTSYWGENEPNGKTEENCVDIKTFTTERSWNDEICSRSLNWICEMKLTQ